MTEYRVTARRIDSHGSPAAANRAEVVLDTDLAGREDAMNPVELLLSALAACMLKGIERARPMLRFRITGAEVALEAVRQEQRRSPGPGMLGRRAQAAARSRGVHSRYVRSLSDLPAHGRRVRIALTVRRFRRCGNDVSAQGDLRRAVR